MLNTPKSPKSNLSVRHRLSNIIESYPFLFWGGMWAMAMMVAIAAIASLLHPNLLSGDFQSSQNPPETREEPLEDNLENPSLSDQTETGLDSQTSLETSPNTPQNSQDNGLEQLSPLWLFILITVGCGGSSLLVTLGLRYISATFQKNKIPSPPPQRKISKKTPPQSVQVPSVSPPLSPESRVPHPAVNPPLAVVPPPNSPSLSGPTVTIVPPEMVTPLDTSIPRDGKPTNNLADQLDIRKYHSLSSLLDYRESAE